MMERVMLGSGFQCLLVIASLIASDLFPWLVGAVGALFVCTFFVVRKWNAYSLPIRMIPLDLVTIVLLIDLNMKALNNVTVDNLIMKMEAIAFTALLTFVFFAPVVWRIVHHERRSSPR